MRQEDQHRNDPRKQKFEAILFNTLLYPRKEFLEIIEVISFERHK